MADNNLKNRSDRTDEEQTAEERAEEVRESAKRIAAQILTLTRNGLFVSLRFLDLALCQFEYINTDKFKGISTTGQHIVYNSQYVIESYMKDRQALSRDYLHMVLHCVFRHPFVSENMEEEYWNLAADIAVETIIDELDLKQTMTNDCEEVSKEVARIKTMMRQVTAEQVYQMLLSGSVSSKDIAKWKKLFYRDDHRVWWEIAKQIAEELKRRQEEEEKKDEPPESDRESQNDSLKENDEEDQEANEDEKEGAGDEDSDSDSEASEEDQTDEESGENAEQDDEDAGEDGEEDRKDDAEDSQENGEDGAEDGGEDGADEEGQDPEGEEDQEEGFEEDEYEDEYSSTPGQTLERENPDDVADPDSDTQESDRENNDNGRGGGKPDDHPEQSDQEGDSRKNDQTGEGLEGKDDHHKPEGKNNSADSLSGSTDEGKRDDSLGDDPFSGEEKQSGALGEGGNNSKGSGEQHGQKSAGTGGGGDGAQSAWQHDSGGANRRGDGEKNEEDRQQLAGSVSPDDQQEISSDDQTREEAIPTEASKDSGSDEDKEPSFMHSESEQEELKDKWKDISERILVDLQTSSKEWGDKSDTMLQGVKKINRDKYDYSTFLRKFATMREDIQINPEEFDYVYYTYGMERYGNIPLIEPLEYKEVKKVRDFVIAIDTSGSCAGEVVQKFLDKTYSLFTQQENFFKKINLHIIQCDAQIQSDVKITSREEFDDYVRDLEFKGFGGTDFRPVFEYVNELIDQNEFDDLKGLIYFTDGNGTYPKKRPPYETAFVFVDDDEFEYEVPSWAMKLVLETSDIMQEVLI